MVASKIMAALFLANKGSLIMVAVIMPVVMLIKSIAYKSISY